MKMLHQEFSHIWLVRLLLMVLGIVLAIGFLHGLFTTFARSRFLPEPISLASTDRNKDIILALGESTTAMLTGPAWPEFLEKILNDRVGHEKFRVLNLGVSGTNTDDIVQNIDRYVSMYHPTTVISMIGINDLSYSALPELSLPWYKDMVVRITRTSFYRFISILVRQIVGRSRGDLLQKASRCADGAMGEVALRQIEERGNLATESMRSAFIDAYPFSFYGYKMLIDYYAQENRWSDVAAWVHRANTMEPFIRYCVATTSGMNIARKKELERQIDVAFAYISSMDTVSYVVKEDPQKISSTWYQNTRTMLFVPPEKRTVNTEVNYQKLSTYLQARNIHHVAMQYPLYPLRDLKRMLGEHKGVRFVSNEENFHHALKEYTYDQVFIDHFTGVFGHTTELGSRLIAESAANTILNSGLAQ